MNKSFYITTTLPYVNADPHVGFALEIIRADVIARYKKIVGHEVFFNTGTDEHGLKLWKTAKKEGKEIKDFVDGYAERFKGLIEILGISDDINFIRTTDQKHIEATKEFWKRVYDRGFIYKKQYKTKYCIGCEQEKTDSELGENGNCLIHPTTPIEIIEEENYFFKLSECEEYLKKLFSENPDFITPSFRQNEMVSFIERGLEDFSVSRLKDKMPWGISVPNDESHVMYVWFDALVNYISTLGWPNDKETFSKFWEKGTTIQFCGKDNTRFQSIIWQAMLYACGLSVTDKIVVNGFVTGDGGIKMSKSLGNVLNPYDIVSEYGTDALRHFVCAKVHPFEDSPFTIERFHDSYNGDLANGLGNLANRILKMASNYGAWGDEIFSEKYSAEKAHEIWLKSDNIPISRNIEMFNLYEAMAEIGRKISACDKKINETEPFKMYKVDPEGAIKIVSETVSDLYEIAVLLEPFMPDSSSKIISAIKGKMTLPTPLFMRKD